MKRRSFLQLLGIGVGAAKVGHVSAESEVPVAPVMSHSIDPSTGERLPLFEQVAADGTRVPLRMCEKITILRTEIDFEPTGVSHDFKASVTRRAISYGPDDRVDPRAVGSLYLKSPSTTSFWVMTEDGWKPA